MGRIYEERGSPEHLRWFWSIFGILAKPPDVRLGGREGQNHGHYRGPSFRHDDLEDLRARSNIPAFIDVVMKEASRFYPQVRAVTATGSVIETIGDDDT
jgi:hypothetical protein